MSTLVVVGYGDPYKAEEIRLKLRKLQSEYLLDLEDAVVVVKDEKGKVKLHQAVNLTAAGASPLQGDRKYLPNKSLRHLRRPNRFLEGTNSILEPLRPM
jgi:hypothetical protein